MCLVVCVVHDIQQDFIWNPPDFMKSSRFHEMQQNFTWHPPDFTKSGDFMKFQQDFTKSSGFHEIQQDVTETNSISCEMHLISWNSQMKSGQILLKFTELHSISHKPQDFTWNPADYTKTSGFHDIQQDFTETNRISYIGFHMKSTWFHKIWGISWSSTGFYKI